MRLRFGEPYTLVLICNRCPHITISSTRIHSQRQCIIWSPTYESDSEGPVRWPVSEYISKVELARLSDRLGVRWREKEVKNDG